MKIVKIIFVTTFFLLAHNSCSQGFSNSFTKKNYYIEVKYEFINELIIIPVEIEGEKYRFLFDTGAPNFITNKFSLSCSNFYFHIYAYLALVYSC